MTTSYAVSRLVGECIFEKFDPDRTARRMVAVDRETVVPAVDQETDKAQIESAVAQLKQKWNNEAAGSVRMHSLLEKSFKADICNRKAVKLGSNTLEAKILSAKALEYERGAESLKNASNNLDFILAGEKIKLEAVEMEKFIIEPNRNVRGRIDGIFKSPMNESNVYLVDWKQCKDIYRSFGCGRNIFKQFDNTRFNKFSLQLNIYKYILENEYKTIVDKMIVINKDSVDGNIKYITVPNMQVFIQELFENENVWNCVVVENYNK